MSYKKRKILATGETYHLFNRSVGDEEIFIEGKFIKRVFETIDYYRYHQEIRYSQYKLLPNLAQKDYMKKVLKNEPLIDIYVYSFMPNHFHLLIKQQIKNGIMKFVSNFQNSYAKYFNRSKKRYGGVFVTSFKAKRVETEEQFIHISRYIHINHVTGYLLTLDELKNNLCTSFSTYYGIKKQPFVNTKKILDIFKTRERYLKFISDQIDYQRKLSKIKRFLLE